MNIWKPANKKSKKLSNETPSTEAGAALPDVVAGLCYGDAGHEVASLSEGAMIGYSSYYSDTQETRGRRREPRSHHTITPQGIGATPLGGYLPHPPHELGVVPAPPQGGTLRRLELSQAWSPQRASTLDYNWNHSFTVSPSGAPDAAGGSYGAGPGLSNYSSCLGGETLEGARVRSMSSEPHGHPSNRSNGDRRIRCSSATRNRQPRPRPNNHLTEQHQHQQHTPSSPPLRCLIPPPNNLSPPSTSPPVQRIEYQQTSTAAVPTAGSARTTAGTLRGGGATAQEFREGIERDPLPETTSTTTTRTEDIGVPGGGSYGYQVPDLEALLTHASPTRPANLPMVLASSTRLHNMRRSQENQAGAVGQTNPQLPVRPILPLGIIVNAVFKTRDWLYVRTAHGAEGYVPYRVCLPLGILPPNRRSPPDTSNDNVASGGIGPWELRGGGEYSGVSISNGATPRLVPSKSQPSAGFNSNTLGGAPPGPQQHRGRHRARRRVNAENTNQTDMQKLQPSTTRIPSESHGPPREILDSPPSTNASDIV